MCQYASRKELGIHFSDSIISSNTKYTLHNTPQIIVSDKDYIIDKINWLEYNFKYKAKGGEKYITIGNFNDTTKVDTLYLGSGERNITDGIYYYIDNIYLGHCDSLPRSVEEQSNLSVFPNPTRGQINISTTDELASIEVFNMQGQLVQSVISTERTWDLPESKGVYWLRIINREGKILGKKIMKQ